MWDFENRLTQVVNPCVGSTTFRYDPLGRRIQKSGPFGITNYLYSGINAVDEVDDSGNVFARYTQGTGLDEPLSDFRGSTTVYYQQDGIDSVTSLTSSAGALANTYTFDSFGKLIASSGTLTNPFQYTSREFDSDTSLYYYRARYYNPNDGRFLSEDPLRLEGGNPNFYGYTSSSPTNFVDPLGEQIGVKGNYQLYEMAIMYLESSPSAAKLIHELENAPEVYMVDLSDLVPEDSIDQYTLTTIYWNPHQALCVENGIQSPALQLFHEMVHLWQHRHHIPRFGFYPPGSGNYVDLWEQPAVQKTNPVATQLGEATRANYDDAGTTPNEADPTTHNRPCHCQN